MATQVEELVWHRLSSPQLIQHRLTTPSKRTSDEHLMMMMPHQTGHRQRGTGDFECQWPFFSMHIPFNSNLAPDIIRFLSRLLYLNLQPWHLCKHTDLTVPLFRSGEVHNQLGHTANKWLHRVGLIKSQTYVYGCEWILLPIRVELEKNTWPPYMHSKGVNPGAEFSYRALHVVIQYSCRKYWVQTAL